jgi:lysophospholipase L1-like esterase
MSGSDLDPGPFLRGSAGATTGPFASRLPQPDDSRLPADVADTATLPAGLRLELTGDARSLTVAYRPGGGHRLHPPSMSPCFSVWSGGRCTARVPVTAGQQVAALPLPERSDPAEPVGVYLPEGVRPALTGLTADGGQVAPAPRQPRLLVYGDSIAQGWSASEPALSWPAVAGRALGLDACNLGFAGAGRGELAVAEQLAGCEAEALTLAFGTNCWERVPMGAAMLTEVTRSFIQVLRSGHPTAPLAVLTPIVRPAAERTANRFGADLRSLRTAIETAVRGLRSDGDTKLILLDGAGLVAAGDLADGIHPGDAGHQSMAAAVTRALRDPGLPSSLIRSEEYVHEA